ncbi:MAG: phosphoesterase [Gammaproteobacteria bacterium GWE2_37_16]|nr:MAG: phosphoesterase [Gammaproteobacteria bacterium GWE2_37_16]
MIRNPSPSAHWRDSARSARFFIVDAQAAFPLLLFLMHITLWTFIVAVVTMLFFTVLNRFGFSVIVFGRLVRSFMAGKRKSAYPWWL